MTTQTQKTTQTNKTNQTTQIPWGCPLPAQEVGEKVWLWYTRRYSVRAGTVGRQHKVRISVKSAIRHGNAWTIRVYQDGVLTSTETYSRWTDIEFWFARRVEEVERTRLRDQAELEKELKESEERLWGRKN